MPWVTTTSGSSSPGAESYCGLHNAGPRGHGHHRGKISGGLVVRHVAMFIGLHPFDQSKVRGQSVFEQVRPAVELTGFLAFGQGRSHGGWGVEGFDPSAAGANTLGQRPLGHQLKFSESLLRYNSGKTVELAVLGNEQITFVTRRAFSRAARPTSPLPQLLLMIVRS